MLVVYSINLKHSFEVVKKYLQSLHQLTLAGTKQFATPVHLVGCKGMLAPLPCPTRLFGRSLTLSFLYTFTEDLDRTFKRLVSADAGAQLAAQFGFPFAECSAVCHRPVILSSSPSLFSSRI